MHFFFATGFYEFKHHLLHYECTSITELEPPFIITYYIIILYYITNCNVIFLLKKWWHLLMICVCLGTEFLFLHESFLIPLTGAVKRSTRPPFSTPRIHHRSLNDSQASVHSLKGCSLMRVMHELFTKTLRSLLRCGYTSPCDRLKLASIWSLYYQMLSFRAFFS